MSTLSRRGAYANQPAQLPGIQTARIGDANVRQAVESLREWVEVRLGARGDKFERAATGRDLTQSFDRLDARLKKIERQLTVLEVPEGQSAASGGASASELSSLQSQVAAIQNEVTQLKTLLANNQVLTRLDTLETDVNQLEADAAASSTVYELLISSNTAVPDLNLSSTFLLLVDDDVQVTLPNNARNGQPFTIFMQQDGVGGHAVTFASPYVFVDSLSSSVPTQPGAVTILEGFFQDAPTGDRVLVTGFSKFSTRSPFVGFSFAFSASAAVGASTHAAAGSSAAVATTTGFWSFVGGQSEASATVAGAGNAIVPATGSAAGSST